MDSEKISRSWMKGNDMFDIVINPAGASGKTKKKWKEVIEPIFLAKKIKYKVHYSTLHYDIPDILKELTSKGEKKDIILVGGDGTVNLAVNGIQDFENTRIGLIPTGSGNDFALGVGIKKDIEQCTRNILEGITRRSVDIGETIYYDRYDELQKEKPSSDGCVHRKFMISSGIGFDAAICQQAQISKTKKTLNQIHLGKLIYIQTAIRIIASTKRVPATITINGITHEYPNLLFTVGMNEPFEGGGFKFCPHAKDDDGKLDLCVGDGLSQFDFFRIFPYAYSGSHLKFKGVYETRNKEVEIKTERPMWVHTDGEVACKSTHIKMHILPEKLMMLN